MGQEPLNQVTEKSWYVYIIECQNDALYTGVTNDLARRMKTHKSGKGCKYVRANGFRELLHAIKVDTKSEALKLEYKIKQLKRNDKITFFMQHDGQQF